jgi:hypothetical protein
MLTLLASLSVTRGHEAIIARAYDELRSYLGVELNSGVLLIF